MIKREHNLSRGINKAPFIVFCLNGREAIYKTTSLMKLGIDDELSRRVYEPVSASYPDCRKAFSKVSGFVKLRLYDNVARPIDIPPLAILLYQVEAACVLSKAE